MLCQSNPIARYLGHVYRGKGGEVLYPGNNDPRLMHAIDTILELSSEFLGKYVGFLFNQENYD